MGWRREPSGVGNHGRQLVLGVLRLATRGGVQTAELRVSSYDRNIHREGGVEAAARCQQSSCPLALATGMCPSTPACELRRRQDKGAMLVNRSCGWANDVL